MILWYAFLPSPIVASRVTVFPIATTSASSFTTSDKLCISREYPPHSFLFRHLFTVSSISSLICLISSCSCSSFSLCIFNSASLSLLLSSTAAFSFIFSIPLLTGLNPDNPVTSSLCFSLCFFKKASNGLDGADSSPSPCFSCTSLGIAKRWTEVLLSSVCTTSAKEDLESTDPFRSSSSPANCGFGRAAILGLRGGGRSNLSRNDLAYNCSVEISPSCSACAVTSTSSIAPTIDEAKLDVRLCAKSSCRHECLSASIPIEKLPAAIKLRMSFS
mmetsp:Transcript_10360/g.27153  ORF Transcript_10360/g.27153 Transcript_10360/m.27153 type:complete len:274 (+) Transcript_10360:300-1121(+)